jgi:hypothetical protein
MTGKRERASRETAIRKATLGCWIQKDMERRRKI